LSIFVLLKWINFARQTDICRESVLIAYSVNKAFYNWFIKMYILTLYTGVMHWCICVKQCTTPSMVNFSVARYGWMVIRLHFWLINKINFVKVIFFFGIFGMFPHLNFTHPVSFLGYITIHLYNWNPNIYLIYFATHLPSTWFIPATAHR